MSLTSILDQVEQGYATAHEVVTKGIAELRGVATAVDSDPVVQKALAIADDLDPVVKSAAAEVLPLLTGVHPDAISGVMSILRAVIAAAPKVAPAV